MRGTGRVAVFCLAAGAMVLACATSPGNQAPALATRPVEPRPPIAPDEPISLPAPEPDPAPDAGALLDRLDDGQRALRPWLERMCQVGVAPYDASMLPELTGRVELGCTCCPPFDDCPPSEDKEIVALEVGAALYPLRHVSEGSFSEPGVDQVAATFFGCEPGYANRGGTMVFDVAADGLVVTAYRSGINPDTCMTFAMRDGRDRILCSTTDGQGASGYTRVVLYDLAHDVEATGAHHTVAELLTDGICLLGTDMPWVETQLDGMTPVDFDGDGSLDLRLDVSHRGGVITDSQMEACQSADELALLPPGLPEPHSHTLEYRAQNGTLVATPATRSTLDKLYAQREAWWSHHQ